MQNSNHNLNDMYRKINQTDLSSILSEMAEYVRHTDQESIKDYFLELSRTGLFYDAIGVITHIDMSDNSITITTDY